MAQLPLPPTLMRGSKGEAVKGLQNALIVRSHPFGAVDGVFGPATENAVKQFQSHAGLAEDGIAGPNTWKALGVYVVQSGDTLSGIAEQLVGDANGWPRSSNSTALLSAILTRSLLAKCLCGGTRGKRGSDFAAARSNQALKRAAQTAQAVG